MRIAVVGLGRMGRFYAQAIAGLGQTVELVAVADPDSRARASVQSELDVPRAFDDPAAVLDRSDVDAVVIATPTSTHADVIVDAARAGKAIFCEKPLALSLEQTRAALRAVESAGVMLQVGFMRRFDPAYQQAKALIDAGRIGRPTTFKGIGRDPECPPLGYANPAVSGGLVLDMAIHDFDLARWLMSSDVDRVSAEGALLACEQLSTVSDIDNAVINIRFASGAVGNVEVSRNARYGYDIRTEVLGTGGAIRVGGSAEQAREVQLLTPQPVDLDADVPHFVRRFAIAYRAQIEHFVECWHKHRAPSVGGADALAAFEIAQAATEAWQTGRSIGVALLHAN
jgi:scyllo-inositol 2-dehydrogenase (NAD+)